ncbi:AtpZ/AtpI family protein [Flavobacteriales bacterium]|jgi:ATP synthase protein I|nr:AtpZ/AtpI family protein [Flavobacteriales bacterium]
MDNHKNFLFFSNLAIQMGVIIFGGVYMGNYLDKSSNNSTPWWTLLFSLVSIAIAFYQVFKSLKKNV